MYSEQIKYILKLFTSNGIKIKKGMNQKQIVKAQRFYDIVFPPDLKELLMACTPISGLFYDWNDYSPENVKKIKSQIMWPIEGALFDVENNDFWLKSWGKKSVDIQTRLNEAKEHMEKAPKLIPVYSHRYISSYPNEAQNPIYSVYQMDIIFYGRDIRDYFDVEFNKKSQRDIEIDKIKPIPFWHDIITNIENIAESYCGMLLPEK